ncbi:MAG: hypothetical protein JWM04_2207, partial [Verrucomicrobiales bacterium]|nr:hypothetical protein [Verrucomicrobiales bacterium]
MSSDTPSGASQNQANLRQIVLHMVFCRVPGRWIVITSAVICGLTCE